MGLRLAPDLSFCMIGDRPIFLDVARDRYFSLAATEAQGFCRLVRGGAIGEAKSALARLLDLGILEVAPAGVRPAPVDIRPSTHAFDPEASDKASLSRTIAALARQLHADWLTRHRTLRSIVRGLSSIPCPRPGQDSVMSDILVAHMRADLWLSPHDRCLSKSVALLADLRRHGVDARLVFGVAARPFAAHCWVQRHNAILNGSLEQARLFTPILAV